MSCNPPVNLGELEMCSTLGFTQMVMAEAQFLVCESVFGSVSWTFNRIASSQVVTLLCIADCMVHSIWSSGKDPDSFSIPYLTALGDLLGTALLALSFHFLWVIGDQDSDVGDWE